MTITGTCPWDIFTKNEFASSVVVVMMIKTKTVVAMSGTTMKEMKEMKMKKVMKMVKTRSESRRGQTEAATQAEFPL